MIGRASIINTGVSGDTVPASKQSEMLMHDIVLIPQDAERGNLLPTAARVSEESRRTNR